MSEQQEVEIRMLLHDQMSDQLKMSFVLWTRYAVRELIRQRCRFDAEERRPVSGALEFHAAKADETGVRSNDVRDCSYTHQWARHPSGTWRDDEKACR
ncbi:MAG: hypothetical protein E5299_01832 [Burkholderia gladioli]|nr:MAG: hypothetical protein E5299_01832 [Burkholderia gladioli]